MTVNDAGYTVIRLLGKGKGGYSYLSFTNYGDVADSYYEVRVNITDVFQNMI